MTLILDAPSSCLGSREPQYVAAQQLLELSELSQQEVLTVVNCHPVLNKSKNEIEIEGFGICPKEGREKGLTQPLLRLATMPCQKEGLKILKASILSRASEIAECVSPRHVLTALFSHHRPWVEMRPFGDAPRSFVGRRRATAARDPD